MWRQRKAGKEPRGLQRECSGVVPCETPGETLDSEKDPPQTWDCRLLRHVTPFISSSILQ